MTLRIKPVVKQFTAGNEIYMFDLFGSTGQPEIVEMVGYGWSGAIALVAGWAQSTLCHYQAAKYLKYAIEAGGEFPPLVRGDHLENVADTVLAPIFGLYGLHSSSAGFQLMLQKVYSPANWERRLSDAEIARFICDQIVVSVPSSSAVGDPNLAMFDNQQEDYIPLISASDIGVALESGAAQITHSYTVPVDSGQLVIETKHNNNRSPLFQNSRLTVLF